MTSVPNQEKYAFNECVVPDKIISMFVLENPYCMEKFHNAVALAY